MHYRSTDPQIINQTNSPKGLLVAKIK